MTTVEPGHVFVVHADLTKLACDVYLVPTDVHLWVTGHWHAFGTPLSQNPPGWANDGRRVTDLAPAHDGEALVGWVNTGSLPDRDPVDWLTEGVRQALDEAGKRLAGRTPRHGRVRPLVGLPVFGIGEGGFGGKRGEVLGELFGFLADYVRTVEFDVAFVCRRRSDYAALQNQPQRLVAADASLSADHLVEAERLGAMVRERNLVLFLGAGVSMPAGLPDWPTLLQQLASAPVSQDDDLLDLAQAVRSALDQDEFHRKLTEALRRDQHALGHGLLASLRADEVVTTNFDDLYELAAGATFEPRNLDVLPWDRAASGSPWLLKMHGGIGRSHVILTRSDYQGFDENWRPVAAIVQALLMTKHMLFVGYSLSDENFIELGRGVSRVLTATTTSDGHPPERRLVGTVVTLAQREELARTWQDDLRVVTIDPSTAKPSNVSARRLEIFLDRIAAVAAQDERSYVLDERYEHLLRDGVARELAAECRALARRLEATDDPAWAPITDTLRALGARPNPRKTEA